MIDYEQIHEFYLLIDIFSRLQAIFGKFYRIECDKEKKHIFLSRIFNMNLILSWRYSTTLEF